MDEESKAQDDVSGELAAMRRRIGELEALQRTGLQLSSSLDLSEVLDAIAKSAVGLVGASDCLIYLYDPESDSYSFGTACGTWVEEGAVLAPRLDGLTATVVREGRPVAINDAAKHPLYSAPEAQAWKIRSIAGFPLGQARRVVGVLHVAFFEQHAFCDADLRLLGLLADQAGIAVENAMLYAKAQREIAVRLQTEEDLRCLHELNALIVQNMAEAIFVFDAAECFTFVNPAAEALLGIKNDEPVGQHWKTVVPLDQQPIVKAANERRALGQSDRYMLELQSKEGRRVPSQVSGSPPQKPVPV